MSDLVVTRVFLRDYRSHTKDDPPRDKWDTGCACCPDGLHRFYRAVAHDPATDQPVDWVDQVRRVLERLPEGTIVDIIVRDTEVRSPMAYDPWVLLKPHTYGPLSKRGAEEATPETPEREGP